MDKNTKIKKRLIKGIIIFLCTMAVFVIVSRTVYDYLLPVIEPQKVSSGRVETKRILDGKIGLDERAIKGKKITLTSPIAGKTADFKIEEGTEVKAGDELFTIEKDEDSAEALSVQLDRLETEELILKEQGLLRQIQNSEEKRQELEATYKKKKEELEKLDRSRELLDLSSELMDMKQQINEQTQIVSVNETLHEEGLIEEATYKREKEKLAILKKKIEELGRTKTKEAEEGIKDIQAKLHTAVLEEANLKDELTLNQKKIKLKQNNDTKKVIKSPISGYVYTLHVGEGTRVEKAENLVAIIPKGISCYLSFEVPNDKAEDIAIGQEVSFILNQIPQKAKIIKQNFDEKTGNLVITGELEKEVLEKLKLDYKSYKQVKVEILKSLGPYRCIVPQSTVTTEYGRSYVYTIEEKSGVWGKVYKARKVDVTMIEEGDYNCAIEGAISQDHQIIKYPISSLKDGDEIALLLGERQ